MDPLLRAEKVVYRYGSIPAIRGLSMEVRQGERIALLGANGSGKSTLLRMFDGLLFPEEGTLYFEDRPLTQQSLDSDEFCFEFRRRVTLLFQDSDAQLFNPTVFDEVAFGPMQLGWTREEAAARVERELEAMRISHLRDRAPYQLSGGEKKRVALASVLVLDPEVLLLDEPTAAMDPRSQDELLDLLLDMPANRTIITATHNLALSRHLADRCYVLDEGKIAASGPLEETLADRSLLEEANLISRTRESLTGY
jgi:cobalt/nickel transport system ATP-binding protein